MGELSEPVSSRGKVLFAAFRYSIPVLLGYVTIGLAFGLFLSETGYPWWLAFVMSFWMFAGAAQFIAVGLFAAGTSLWEACFIQLVVNARHMAYGLSMLTHYRDTGFLKPYLVFSLTDETFALLSTPPEMPAEEKRLFMFYVSLLDQSYWITGSVVGALAGALFPFDMTGVGFALTALFVVLMIEQIKKSKNYRLFILSAVAAIAGLLLFPGRISLLISLVLALFFSPFIKTGKKEKK